MGVFFCEGGSSVTRFRFTSEVQPKDPKRGDFIFSCETSVSAAMALTCVVFGRPPEWGCWQTAGDWSTGKARVRVLIVVAYLQKPPNFSPTSTSPGHWASSSAPCTPSSWPRRIRADPAAFRPLIPPFANDAASAVRAEKPMQWFTQNFELL